MTGVLVWEAGFGGGVIVGNTCFGWLTTCSGNITKSIAYRYSHGIMSLIQHSSFIFPKLVE